MENLGQFATNTLSATIILFAVIDILGSLPIVVSLRQSGQKINPFQTSGVALAILVAFMFLGQGLLSLFGVDVNSFAVAGAFVLFVLGCEMVLGMNIFKQDSPSGASIVPLAFPLLAGPGTFTTIIALQAEFSTPVILTALIINMMFVFIVLNSTKLIEKLLGNGGIYVVKKFFGIILLAIAVKLFASNISVLIGG